METYRIIFRDTADSQHEVLVKCTLAGVNAIATALYLQGSLSVRVYAGDKEQYNEEPIINLRVY
jgi:hypothetical protein